MFWRAASAMAALALVATAALATPPNVIVSAEYSEPTDRYDHGILGDAIEWGALRMVVDQCFGCETKAMKTFVLRLPATRVFEDVAPRLYDVDGDETPEVIVVETDLSLGARLAIYHEGGLSAATPFIGRSNRWLAPVGVGAADLDGDGSVELAYVDRPHLAKTLRVFRYQDDELKLVGELPGVTNHRIGERDIAGGIRDCGDGPEMIVADASWRNILAVQFDGSDFNQRVLGPHEGRSSFADAMACRN
ncbi:MAG: VCBS repeat-containing protein [Boseongicola sp.]